MQTKKRRKMQCISEDLRFGILCSVVTTDLTLLRKKMLPAFWYTACCKPTNKKLLSNSLLVKYVLRHGREKRNC